MFGIIPLSFNASSPGNTTNIRINAPSALLRACAYILYCHKLESLSYIFAPDHNVQRQSLVTYCFTERKLTGWGGYLALVGYCDSQTRCSYSFGHRSQFTRIICNL